LHPEALVAVKEDGPRHEARKELWVHASPEPGTRACVRADSVHQRLDLSRAHLERILLGRRETHERMAQAPHGWERIAVRTDAKESVAGVGDRHRDRSIGADRGRA